MKKLSWIRNFIYISILFEISILLPMYFIDISDEKLFNLYAISVILTFISTKIIMEKLLNCKIEFFR